MSTLSKFVVACVVSVQTVSLFAQLNPGTETGLPANSVYSGSGLDQVNLQNGNLHIEIPIVSAAQRGGGALSWKYVYDSPEWNLSGIKQPNGTVSYGVVLVDGGGYANWRLLNPLVWGGDFQESQVTCASTHVQYTQITNVVVIEPNGTRHPVPIRVETGSSCLGQTLQAPALDGSGLTYNWTTNTVTLKNGTTISSVLVQDSNGNQMNGASGADTLNRNLITKTDGPTMQYVTPLGKTVNGPQYTNYTVKDSGGISQIFRVDYQAVDTVSSMCSLVTGSTCTEALPSAQFVPRILTLPNLATYVFTFNNNTPGELARLDLPSGGFITYTYRDAYILQPIHVGTPNSWDGRRGVASRTVNVGGIASTWNYSGTIFGNSGSVVNPDNSQEAHTFAKITANSATSSSVYETKATYSDSNSNVFRTVTKDYTGEKDPYTSGLLVNVRPIRTTTTLDNNQIKKTETDYETFQYTCGGGTCPATATRMNPTEVREFDYASGTAGPLLRRTDYTYLHTGNSTYQNLNIVDKATSVITNSATGTPVAKTLYEFDNYSHPNQAMQSSGAVQHNSTFTTSYTPRGNQTAIQHWRNSDGALLTTTNQYDDAGNLISSIDPLGNKTSYDFTDSWSNTSCAPSSGQGKAYITKVTNALNQTTTHMYNSCTASIASTTDSNSNPTTYIYDAMGRTLSVTDPLQTVNGSAMHGVTTYVYTDTPNSVNVEKKDTIDGSRSTDDFFYFDGLGREISHSHANGQSPAWDKNDTCYDPNGRKRFASYPYQASSTSPPSSCPSEAGDFFAYDALSRILTVTHSDSTVIRTAYTGRATDVTDEGNGNATSSERVSQVDGLGRLIAVCEVTAATQQGPGGTPAACGQDTAKTGFLTTYGYDALDNLLSVSQGSMGLRSFTYDSLSHVITATNPESGTTCYGTWSSGTCVNGYDAAGNLISRTRAAPNQTSNSTYVTTTYGYDGLNRLKSRLYSDGTTAQAKFSYDLSTVTMGTTQVPITNSIGRLSWSATQDSGSNPLAMNAYSYDSMGRVLLNAECVALNCPHLFNFNYGYDLLGDVLTSANGNGITYTNTYSVAPILTAMATSWLSSTTSGNLIFNMQYNGFGTPNSAQLNNNILEGWGYDTRGRPQSYSAVVGADTRYGFSAVTYSGNGSILSANDRINGTWVYTYEDFNRIATSSCTATCPNGTAIQAFSYQYDRYGNRWKQTVTAGSGPQPTLTFNGPGNVPNNRIDTYSYDAAGNLLNDGAHTYTYDAENRLIKVDGGSTGNYAYDADGRRVSRVASSSSYQYLFDIGGRAVSEILMGTTTTNRTEAYAGGRHVATQSVGLGTTYYIHTDWLGTERARTNASNAVVESCQSLPFGDGQICSGADVSPVHFTGKQRDTESNLDDFDARYYSSQFGRFMTPDWDVKPVTVPYAKFGDPLSLNLYAYVENAPLNRIDADGHEQNTGAQPTPNPPQPDCGPGGVPKDCMTAQNQSLGDKIETTLTNFAHAEADFFKTYIQEIDSNIPFSGVSSPSGDKGVEKAAIGAGFVAGFVVPEGEAGKGATSVYTIGKDAYVGITNNLERRAGEHGVEALTKVAGGLTRDGARGVEQALIEHHGLGKNGGTLANKINSIAKTNPIYEKAVAFGRQVLQSIGYVP